MTFQRVNTSWIGDGIDAVVILVVSFTVVAELAFVSSAVTNEFLRMSVFEIGLSWPGLKSLTTK